MVECFAYGSEIEGRDALHPDFQVTTEVRIDQIDIRMLTMTTTVQFTGLKHELFFVNYSKVDLLAETHD